MADNSAITVTGTSSDGSALSYITAQISRYQNLYSTGAISEAEYQNAMSQITQTYLDYLNNSGSGDGSGSSSTTDLSSYANVINNLNNPNRSLAGILGELGSTTNPSSLSYTQPNYVDASEPTLMNAAEYLKALGLEDYADAIDKDALLAAYNEAAKTGYDATQQELLAANNELGRNISNNQNSLMDTIRGQYAQGIQSGVNKGMQNANLLSSILGTSQANAANATEQLQSRIAAANDYGQQLAQNQVNALNTANTNMETLMGNIRQIYNDQIQDRTASLEYNASNWESLANLLAQKYASDTNYAQTQSSNATSVYNNNQNALATLLANVNSAKAQDNYSNAFANAYGQSTNMIYS